MATHKRGGAVRVVKPYAPVVFEEPSEEEKLKRGVLRAMTDILGYRNEEKAWELTQKILDIADDAQDPDTRIVEMMKGAYSAEVISATIDRLRRCREFRALAYGDPAPDGFVGAVDWGQVGSNANVSPGWMGY